MTSKNYWLACLGMFSITLIDFVITLYVKLQNKQILPKSEREYLELEMSSRNISCISFKVDSSMPNEDLSMKKSTVIKSQKQEFEELVQSNLQQAKKTSEIQEFMHSIS